jgi:hypothetical protein
MSASCCWRLESPDMVSHFLRMKELFRLSFAVFAVAVLIAAVTGTS